MGGLSESGIRSEPLTGKIMEIFNYSWNSHFQRSRRCQATWKTNGKANSFVDIGEVQIYIQYSRHHIYT